MKVKNRTIFIGVAIAICITLIFLGYGFFKIYTFMSAFQPKEIPAEIQQPRVLVGDTVFTKSEIFKLGQVSLVQTISEGSQIRDEKERQRAIQSDTARGIFNFSDLRVIGDRVIAVAEFGAFTFDLNGNLLKRVTFEPSEQEIKIGPYTHTAYQGDLSNLRVVDLGQGRIGYLSHGSVQGVRIFNE